MKSLCKRDGWTIAAASLWQNERDLGVNATGTHVRRRAPLDKEFVRHSSSKQLQDLTNLVKRGALRVEDLIGAVELVVATDGFTPVASSAERKHCNLYDYSFDQASLEFAHGLLQLVEASRATPSQNRGSQQSDRVLPPSGALEMRPAHATVVHDWAAITAPTEFSNSTGGDLSAAFAKHAALDDIHKFPQFAAAVVQSMAEQLPGNLTRVESACHMLNASIERAVSGLTSIGACVETCLSISKQAGDGNESRIDRQLVLQSLGIVRDQVANVSGEPASSKSLVAALELITLLYKRAVFVGGDAIVGSVSFLIQRTLSALQAGEHAVVDKLVAQIRSFVEGIADIKDKAVLDRTVSLRDHEKDYKTLQAIREKFSTYGQVENVENAPPDASRKNIVHVVFASRAEADHACLEFAATSNSWRFGPKVAIASGRKPKNPKPAHGDRFGRGNEKRLTPEERDAEEAAAREWFKSKLRHRTATVQRLAEMEAAGEKIPSANSSTTSGDNRRRRKKFTTGGAGAYRAKGPEPDSSSTRYARGPAQDRSKGFELKRTVQVASN